MKVTKSGWSTSISISAYHGTGLAALDVAFTAASRPRVLTGTRRIAAIANTAETTSQP
jgi:hypothetical protein